MTLKWITMTLAGLYLVCGALLLAKPAMCRKALLAFPRNRLAGWILAAVAVAWSAWLMKDFPLGRFEYIRPAIPVLACVLYGLIVCFVDDLLSVRAFGGVLLLVPAPILAVTRQYETPWRLVIVVIAYLMAVKGMILVASPFRWRKWTEQFLAADENTKPWGIVAVVLGVCLAVLGLLVS